MNPPIKTLAPALSVAAVIAAAIAVVSAAPFAVSSDHIDSPTLAQDHGSDLGDTYAFLDPTDSSEVVLTMTTNPFIISSEAIGQAIFDPNLRYRFEIENTGDARPDRFIDVRYSRGVGRTQAQRATITLPGGRRFTAPTTPAAQGDTPPRARVTTRSGVSFFAGSVDDPFFLDNTAANRFVLSSIANPGSPNRDVFAERAGPDRVGRDTYAGFNTLATTIRVPRALLRGSSRTNEIGVNSVTQRQRRQLVTRDGEVRSGGGRWTTVDRDGGPLVNNGLIPPPRKNEYNAASTLDDARGLFRADIIRSLRALGTNDRFIRRILAAAVNRGDILRLKLNEPTAFPNGRRLQDDVADGLFTLINNGSPLGDFVEANEAPFSSVFPFFADPIQPNPLGVDNPDDRTRL
ncbi:MAG: DUF4331 domain-containing protein [Actinomycetota bacterium]|nr:DUF4331 domain-containing protein [Actinomycetota bacterium]